MATSIGEIQLDLGVNTKKFQQEMNGIGKTAKASTSKMSNLFSKLSKVVAAAMAVKQVASFGKACLDLGSDLAEVQNVVDVTFGSMSENVNKFAKDAITSYGLSEKVAKEYMGQFGAMSKAFGNGTAAAYEQAEALTALSGDVASFYNLSTDEAFTKLKSVYTGETEALKSLGVVMTQTALDQFALSKGYGKTTKSMTEQEKVALRLAFVQDKLADASGDFARTSDGWANQTRVLALRFDALKASIGQGLINVLTPVIKMLNTLLAKLQQVADAFSNFTASLFGDAGGTTTGQISDDIIGISDGLAEGAESAEAIKKSLAGFDEINVLSSDSGSGSESSGGGIDAGSADITAEVAENTEKSLGFVEKIKSMLSVLKVPEFHFEKSVPGLTMLKDAFVDFLGINWDTFVFLWNDVISPLAEWFINDLAPKSVEHLATAFDSLNEIAKKTLSVIKSLWENFLKPIVDFVNKRVISLVENLTKKWQELKETVQDSEIFEEIKKLVEEIGPVLQAIVGAIIGIVTAIGEFVLNIAWEDFKTLLYDIADVIGLIVDLLNLDFSGALEHAEDLLVDNRLDNAKGKIEAIKESWEGAKKAVKEWAETSGKVLKEWVDDKKQKIVTFWEENIAPWFTEEKWDELFHNIGKSLGNAVKSIGEWWGKNVAPKLTKEYWKNKFTQIGESIKTGIMEAWNSIMTFFNKNIKPMFTVEYWKEFGENMKEGIVSGFKTIVRKGVDCINGIIDAFESGINWIIRKFNSFTSGFLSAFGIESDGPMKEVSFGRVSYPKLASGGYVRANTPQLAIIGDNKHEGEIVAPESKIAEAVAKAMAQFKGGNDRPIYLTVKLGEKDFWSGFVDYHNAEVQRTGTSPLLV